MGEQPNAARWSQIAADFDQIGPPFFADTGRRLVQLAAPPRNGIILDVAAGRGAVLFPAAKWVRRNGRVLSIDLAAGMTQALAKDVKQHALPQASVCQMDGAHLALADAACDAVLCAHAIFYFPQAINAFYRVLRPGGRVGLSIVAQGNFDWLWQVLATYADAGEPTTPDEPAINSPEGLQSLLRRAGFEGLQTREEAVDCVFADEEMWWANLWALGTRGILEQMNPDIRQRFKADLFAALQTFRQVDGLHIPHRTVYAWGRKPRYC
jgi:SAM-dependent methyltransferase